MPPTEDARLEDIVAEIAELKAHAARVKLSHLLERLALVGLVLTLAFLAWRGLPIYYIQDGGPGYALPGQLPADMARDYALRFVETRYGFVPKTFRDQVEACLPWVHPGLHTRFRAEAADEEREIRKYDIKSQVFIAQTHVEKGDSDTALVVLTGLRSVWVGENYREEVFRAEITLVPLRPKSPAFTWGKPGRAGRMVVARTAYTPVLSANQK